MRLPLIRSTWCFDCDGTILDSSATFVMAHTQAVVALGGRPVREYWRRRRAGESEKALCAAAGLPASGFARYQRLRQEAFDTCSLTPSPLPAAALLVGRLSLIGAEVVVISHRSSPESLVRDLRRARVLPFLSNIFATKAPRRVGHRRRDAGAAKSEILKDIAARGPAVMVGDSVTDIAAAESIGMASIGVASGCSSMRRLAVSGATLVVPSLSALYAILFDQGLISSSPLLPTR
jgi:phosphoglycolate phosphatase-like HAD superfamily hydrolase